MSATERVSIIMPLYNVAEFVDTAITSVRDQTWADLDLIAIDDGSTDRSAEIVAARVDDFERPGRRLRLIRQGNRGAAAARNVGLDAVESDFVAFLDADDLWHPDLLTQLMATLRQRPEIDLTFPLYRYIDEQGQALGTESRSGQARYTSADLMIANPIHSATGVLLRAGPIHRAGRFDEDLRACIDLDLWVRIGAQRAGNIAPTPKVLADYRRRAGQITGDWRRMEAAWTRVCEKLRAADRGLDDRQWARGRARHCLYWSTIAYATGDYPASRRLIVETWQRAPGWAAMDSHARVRTAACLCSLLPHAIHDVIRTRFNALRIRLGYDWS